MVGPVQNNGVPGVANCVLLDELVLFHGAQHVTKRERGVSEKRILEANSTLEGQAANRRIEITFMAVW